MDSLSPMPLPTLEREDSAEALTRARRLIAPALRAAVDRLPASMRHLAGYHLGWWDDEGQPATADGGKALRPALVLASAEAIGGRPADAVPAAVAVELLHNASLLHDDVIDRDVTRRHRPTAWTVFGAERAILAGDALQALAFDALADDNGRGMRGIRMLHAAMQELLDGQDADTAAERRTDVGLAEALRIADAKTGGLIGVSCGLGALAGGGGDQEIARLTAFGRQLGRAFQLVDDVLGIWGDSTATGKPSHSDLAGRKKSAPVTYALESSTPAGRELADLYRHDDLDRVGLARCADLVDAAGGRAWCLDEAERLLSAAVGELPPGPAVVALTALARVVVRRDR